MHTTTAPWLVACLLDSSVLAPPACVALTCAFWWGMSRRDLVEPQ